MVQNVIFTANDQSGTDIFELLYNVKTTGTYDLVVFSYGGSYYDFTNKYRIDFYSTKNNESQEFIMRVLS